jgi:hypothetical protein
MKTQHIQVSNMINIKSYFNFPVLRYRHGNTTVMENGVASAGS